MVDASWSSSMTGGMDGVDSRPDEISEGDGEKERMWLKISFFFLFSF